MSLAIGNMVTKIPVTTGGDMPTTIYRMRSETVRKVLDAMESASIMLAVPGWFTLPYSEAVEYLRDPAGYYVRHRGFDREAAQDFLGFDEDDRVALDVQEPRPDRDGEQVYFLRNTTTGAIKVGCSAEPQRRLAQLQTGCPDPLAMIGSVGGGLAKEASIHRLLAPAQISGEWFSPDAWVLRIVEFLISQG